VVRLSWPVKARGPVRVDVAAETQIQQPSWSCRQRRACRPKPSAGAKACKLAAASRPAQVDRQTCQPTTTASGFLPATARLATTSLDGAEGQRDCRKSKIPSLSFSCGRCSGTSCRSGNCGSAAAAQRTFPESASDAGLPALRRHATADLEPGTERRAPLILETFAVPPQLIPQLARPARRSPLQRPQEKEMGFWISAVALPLRAPSSEVVASRAVAGKNPLAVVSAGRLSVNLSQGLLAAASFASLRNR